VPCVAYLQMWQFCQSCKLLDRRVTLADVNRMLQLVRSRHASAVQEAAMARLRCVAVRHVGMLSFSSSSSSSSSLPLALPLPLPLSSSLLSSSPPLPPPPLSHLCCWGCVRRSATPSTAAAGDSTLSTESKMEDAPSVRE
jgi:hypothetical protein